jgi:futalosine hydrolase
MKILLVAATALEIAALLQHLQQHWQSIDAATFMHNDTTVSLCITGVGMVAATYAVTKALFSETYDLALQAGVGGSFNRDIALGTVVQVTSDQYGDLGAEDHDAFLDIFDMGLLQKEEHPYTDGKLVMPGDTLFEKALPVVSGITVNTVSGNAAIIAARSLRYKADVESMEGAAFHYTCLREQVPFAQVRAISNYVEPRNREVWKMKEAIINLNNWLIDYLTTVL